jgi:hypothetical protein
MRVMLHNFKGIAKTPGLYHYSRWNVTKKPHTAFVSVAVLCGRETLCPAGA